MTLTRSSMFTAAFSTALLYSRSNAMPNFVWHVPNGASVPDSPAIGHETDDFLDATRSVETLKTPAWCGPRNSVRLTPTKTDRRTAKNLVIPVVCGQPTSLRSGPLEPPTLETPRKPRIRHFGLRLAAIQPRAPSPTPKVAKVSGSRRYQRSTPINISSIKLSRWSHD